jgi:hypothetical protein
VTLAQQLKNASIGDREVMASTLTDAKAQWQARRKASQDGRAEAQSYGHAARDTKSSARRSDASSLEERRTESLRAAVNARKAMSLSSQAEADKYVAMCAPPEQLSRGLPSHPCVPVWCVGFVRLALQLLAPHGNRAQAERVGSPWGLSGPRGGS